MDIHPEAVKLLNKHRGTDFRPGGEHYVENLIATTAISEALFERDEIKRNYDALTECHLKALSDWPERYIAACKEADSLRAQVAAMREALPFAVAFIERNQTQKEDAFYLEKMKSALSTLKDQSNGH